MKNRLSDAPDLRLFFKALIIEPRRKRLCLSWDSSRFRPSIDPSSRPLQLGPKASLRSVRCQTARFVPLSWFLTTSAAYSVTEFAGLFRPAANHEVHRVSPSPRPLTCRSRCTRAATLPAMSYPSKNSPHRQPFRITAAVALLTLPLDEPAAAEAMTTRTPEGALRHEAWRPRGAADTAPEGMPSA